MPEQSNDELLSQEDRTFLLNLARQSIREALDRQTLSPLDYSQLSPQLKESGATFVTLTCGGELRGCVGALEAYQPLVDDVREHALAAAFNDYRFPPLTTAEFPGIKIEISRLTKPQPLRYDKPEELLKLLKVNNDGVILQFGSRRSTFLPQVWEKIPDPVIFLNHLCEKMGVDPHFWRYKKLQVYTYQVEMFEE
jgi:AmmeMemoRadiSam system protein A